MTIHPQTPQSFQEELAVLSRGMSKEAANSKIVQMLGRKLEQGTRAVAGRSPASILAHEYGHAKTLMGSSPGVRKLRMHLYGKGSQAGSLATLVREFTESGQKAARRLGPSKFGLQQAGIQAAGEAPKLIEEFLASYHGLKALRKFRRVSPSGYKRARKDLIYAYMTYLSGAGTNVAASGVSGAALAGGKSFTGHRVADALAIRLAGVGGNKAAMQGLKKGMKKTPLLGRLGESSLRRLMGQKLKNLQPRSGKPNPLAGFFAPPTKLPPSAKKAIDKLYGKGAWKTIRTEGAISVPRGTLHEIRGRKSKKGLSDKLIEIARKMQS